MKKTIKCILIVLTCLLMLCSLFFTVGCSQNDAELPPNDSEPKEEEPTTPLPPAEDPIIIVVPTYYTVSFDTTGGGNVESQSIKENEKAVKPKNPSNFIEDNVLYKFKGWYIGEEEYDFNLPITGDLTLTAKWDTESYSGDFEIRK